VSFIESEDCTVLANFELMCKLVYHQMLLSDFKVIAVPSMLLDVQTIHKRNLPGSFVLQLEHYINIAAPEADRKNEKANRLLKLWLTDGTKTLIAMEYHRIPHLRASNPLGLKVMVTDVPVRHGVLQLTESNTQVLGGEVLQERH